MFLKSFTTIFLYKIMEEKSIFELLGGEKVINAVVESTFKKVCKDEIIMEYFQEINITFLMNHQKRLWAYITGGPTYYQGRDMRSTHHCLRLEDIHFDRMMEHYIETLHEFEVDPKLIEKMIERIETLKSEILNK
jgi:hemoglobin